MKKIKLRADRPLLLLPNIFKKIGWIVFTLLTAILFVLKFNKGLISNPNSHLFIPWLKSLLMLFAFLPAVSYEKLEDERIASLRARVLAGSFSIAVLLAVFIPVFGPNFMEIATATDVYSFMWFQLGFYHATFFSIKR